jgi:hypothetical protein
MHHAGGQRADEAHGVADGHHQFAHAQRARIAESGRGQAAGFHLERSQVAPRIARQQGGGKLAAIPKPDRGAGVAGHVRVGDDLAIGRGDHPEPPALAPAQAHLHGGAAQPFRDFSEGARHVSLPSWAVLQPLYLVR